MRLTTLHRKTLLLWNLNKGGQGPVWAVAPLDGCMDGWYNVYLYIERELSSVSYELILCT
jgi:hypothetical protein